MGVAPAAAKIVAAVELHDRCRSRMHRSEPASRRMFARSRGFLGGLHADALAPRWPQYGRLGDSRALREPRGTERSCSRRRCRRAGSCCSALRFAAAAPPAISRSFRSAGACSVSRLTKHCSRSAIGNGAVSASSASSRAPCPWASDASWGLSMRPAMARCWSRRRICPGRSSISACARHTPGMVYSQRTPVARRGVGLFPAGGALRGRKAEARWRRGRRRDYFT